MVVENPSRLTGTDLVRPIGTETERAQKDSPEKKDTVEVERSLLTALLEFVVQLLGMKEKEKAKERTSSTVSSSSTPHVTINVNAAPAFPRMPELEQEIARSFKLVNDDFEYTLQQQRAEDAAWNRAFPPIDQLMQDIQAGKVPAAASVDFDPNGPSPVRGGGRGPGTRIRG